MSRDWGIAFPGSQRRRRLGTAGLQPAVRCAAPCRRVSLECRGAVAAQWPAAERPTLVEDASQLWPGGAAACLDRAGGLVPAPPCPSDRAQTAPTRAVEGVAHAAPCRWSGELAAVWPLATDGRGLAARRGCASPGAPRPAHPMAPTPVRPQPLAGAGASPPPTLSDQSDSC